MVVLCDEGVSLEQRRAALFRQYSMTPQGVEQDVQALKEWIAKQPHLPRLPPSLDADRWLEGILILTKNSLERAKQAVDSFCSARTSCASLFKDRDPNTIEMADSFSNVKMAILPGVTEEGHRVLLMKINALSAASYDLTAHMRRCAMIVDLFLQHGVDFTGLHVVHDLEHVGLSHLSVFNLSLMRLMSVSMKAYPCRIPKITIVNTPYFLDKVIALFRPFMAPKLMARVQSYKDASQLLDILPAKIVPCDYGGHAPSLDDLNEHWRKRMELSVDFFTLTDSLKTDESRRPAKSALSDHAVDNGSFRQLAFD